jgi:hypothetical protein
MFCHTLQDHNLIFILRHLPSFNYGSFYGHKALYMILCSFVYCSTKSFSQSKCVCDEMHTVAKFIFIQSTLTKIHKTTMYVLPHIYAWQVTELSAILKYGTFWPTKYYLSSASTDFSNLIKISLFKKCILYYILLGRWSP